MNRVFTVVLFTISWALGQVFVDWLFDKPNLGLMAVKTFLDTLFAVGVYEWLRGDRK